MVGTKHTYHLRPDMMVERARKLILSVDDDIADPVHGSFYRHSTSSDATSCRRR